MIENLRCVTCDRCGMQVIVESGSEDLFLSDFTREVAGIADWRATGADRHLCPVCTTEYARLKARHLKEV